MPRIQLIPKHKANGELRRAYRAAYALWGAGLVAPPFALDIMKCFAHRPVMLQAMAEGYYYAGWCGTLPRTTRELVAVLVSRENECFY